VPSHYRDSGSSSGGGPSKRPCGCALDISIRSHSWGGVSFCTGWFFVTVYMTRLPQLSHYRSHLSQPLFSL
jgi:hypothetical protein